MQVFIVMEYNESLESVNQVYSTLEKAKTQVEFLESCLLSAYIVERKVQ